MKSPYKYLRVWPEHGSSMIWALEAPCQETAGKMVPFEALQLPEALVRQFEAWEEWYSTYLDSLESMQAFPWAAFEAKGLELATELKACLGPEQYLEYMGKVIE